MVFTQLDIPYTIKTRFILHPYNLLDPTELVCVLRFNPYKVANTIES